MVGEVFTIPPYHLKSALWDNCWWGQHFHRKGKNEIFRKIKGVKILDRVEELRKYVNNPELNPLIDRAVFLERKLEELEQLPLLKVHPEKPELQKATPAAKMYKEFLQQYANIMKVLVRGAGDENDTEISPLRSWVKMRSEND